MSADHDAADALNPDAPAHDIIPDSFVADWNATVDYEVTTVREALAVAEAARPETDERDQRLCPRCLSVRIRHKPGGEMPHKRDGNWKCATCETFHFDHPLPPAREAHRDADHAPDADRETHKPRCPDCGSTDLYPVPQRAAAVDERWICRKCRQRFDDAAPSRVEAVETRARRARDRNRPSLPKRHEQATLGEVSDQ